MPPAGYMELNANDLQHRCNICDENLSAEEAKHHFKSDRHIANQCFLIYQRKRRELLVEQHPLGLKVDVVTDNKPKRFQKINGIIHITTQPGETAEFRVILQNMDRSAAMAKDKGLVIDSARLLRDNKCFQLTDDFGITGVRKQPGRLRILPGCSIAVDVKCGDSQLSHHRVVFFISYFNEEQSKLLPTGTRQLSFMAVEFYLRVLTPEILEQLPKDTYESRSATRFNYLRDEYVPGVPLGFNESSGRQDRCGMSEKPQRDLKKYRVPAATKAMFKIQFKTTQFCPPDLRNSVLETKALLSGPVDPSTYCFKFMLLLQCEELQLERDIEYYNMPSVPLVKSNHGGDRGFMLKLEVPGLAEKRPSVLKGDQIFIHSVGSNKEYQGFVHHVEETTVHLCFDKSLKQRHVHGMRYNVRYTVCRYPLRNMYRAIEMVHNGLLEPLLFPTLELADPPVQTGFRDIKPFNRFIEENPEQLQAVKNIVNRSSGTAPYIIFGPPGTGKTVTLVEAIKQVYTNFPEARILVTAPSNSAADTLAARLLDHVGRNKIMRIHAKSRIPFTIPESIRFISNLSCGEIFPMNNPDVLQEFKIIVVTLVSSGEIVSAKLPEDHFTHVFMDEAGQAMEPEALISLAGILSSSNINNKKAQLVLAGDHKQLGPIIRSDMAKKNGLAVSLMERLAIQSRNTKSSVYKKPYDPRFITKLVNNYRSHEAILTLPSRLFYDQELKCKANPATATSMLQFPGLPATAKGKFPLIFHGLLGADQRDSTSPSFFNLEEVMTVVDYVKQLLDMKSNKIAAKDIGIISPYRKQVQKIRKQLSRVNIEDVTVGSTEEFQGQERRVIIISTVRSSPLYVNLDKQFSLGFISNSKRFNVAVTRAKALLIVVGNPYVLKQDNDWGALIKYIKENGGYTGTPFQEYDETDINRLAASLEEMLLNEQEHNLGMSLAMEQEEPQFFGVD